MLIGNTVAYTLTVKLKDYCGVEQRSARLAHNQEVVGSNPTHRNQL